MSKQFGQSPNPQYSPEPSLPLTPPESPTATSIEAWPGKHLASRSPTFADSLAIFSRNEAQTASYTTRKREVPPQKQYLGAEARQSNHNFGARSPRLLSELPVIDESSQLDRKSSIKQPDSTSFWTPSTSISGRFGSLLNRVKQSSPASPTKDDVLDLSISSALCSSDIQELGSKAPQALKNIQTAAEMVLHKAQEGYRARTNEVHDLHQEISKQSDRHEEATMRSEHLKFQLEGMAQRVAEYDAQMESLRVELQTEREAWEMQRQAWKASLADDNVLSTPRNYRDWSDTSSTAGSVMDDDVSVVGSTYTAKPNVSPMRSASVKSSLYLELKGSSETTAIKPKMTLNTPSSLHQRYERLDTMPASCTNCQYQRKAVDVENVRSLRSENSILRERIASLEAAVDGALELVAGLGLR